MPTSLKPGFSAKTDLILQNPKGKVKVVWFVDYTDLHTRRVRDVLMRSTERIQEADVLIAVRVIAGSNENSPEYIAACAAIASAAQDKFSEMHMALFEEAPEYSEASVLVLAEELGLDIEKFKKDLHSATTKKRLEGFINSFKSSEILQSPAYFIDGQPYIGVWDEHDVMEALTKPLGYRVRVASMEFVNWAASSSLMMILATLLALLIANLGFHEQYEHFIEIIAGLKAGSWELMMPLEVWVNDGLMALFFLLVGIEIKHELVEGELSSMKKAAVPVFAALGGMIVPALIYTFINYGNEHTAHGWGIPMATDIAFTLGILMLLGDRVPTSLKVFVSALAIADDLGAIIVIAVFYGHGFDGGAFMSAGIVFAIMIGLNLLKFYNRLIYLILGVFLWYFIYQSGVHATLAGVLTAFAIPSLRGANVEGVSLQTARLVQDDLSNHGELGGHTILRVQDALQRLRGPGFYLQHDLELLCYYFILPIFAFFNTGILLFGSDFSFSNPADLGTFLGLVIGKPLGIVLAVWVAVKLKVGRLSSDISRAQLIGAGFLCGIGFTMSIFIASATFEGAELETVKLSILLASIVAAMIGTIILYRSAPKEHGFDHEAGNVKA